MWCWLGVVVGLVWNWLVWCSPLLRLALVLTGTVWHCTCFIWCDAGHGFGVGLGLAVVWGLGVVVFWCGCGLMGG